MNNCAEVRVVGFLCLQNCANHRGKIWGVGDGLGRPNAGGVVAGGDKSVNPDGDRFLCSASDGVEGADALAIVPVRPVGLTCAEREATKDGREAEGGLYHRSHVNY